MAKLERTDKPVSVLLEELGEGALGLPEIQRSYVWNRPQARDLVDSLYREYPSGLILLWKPKELPELRDTALVENSRETPDFLILDGQQRLTSLTKVFSGEEIDVYFNVEEESFQIYSRKLKANPLWISVKDVINEGAVKVWRKLKPQLDSHSLQIDESKLDEYLDRLSALEKIKEYRYPVMIIHTDDYEESTESFIRVNSRGTRLREAELAMAQLAFHWPGALVKAVDHTINFLRNNAGIESSDWIPSINALVPLVVYLSKKQGQVTDDEVRGLLFWFFEATIHGRFTGSPETKIDQDLRAIESADPINSMVANLRRDVPSFDITPEMIEGKYQRHSFLPLIFAISRKKNAKDWFTGTVLSSTNVGPQHKLELHHIFPKAILKESGDFKTHEMDDIANIAFLSQKANRRILKSKPEDYLSNIEENRLQAQFIPLDRNLWRVNKFRDFLVERRRLITEAINEYMREIGGGYFDV